MIYSCPICLIMEFVVIVLKKSVVRSITAALKTQATAYVTAHVQSELTALAAKAQAGDQAAQAQLANQTQLTQSLVAEYQRAFTRQALLKLSSH